MEYQTYDDLKAFEQRLTEVVAAHRPSRFRRSKLLAVLAFMIFVIWYMFPILKSPWLQSTFTVAVIIIIITIVREHLRAEMAPVVIASQTRSVLEDYSMSCDDAGRLILKAPRSRPPVEIVN